MDEQTASPNLPAGPRFIRVIAYVAAKTSKILMIPGERIVTFTAVVSNSRALQEETWIQGRAYAGKNGGGKEFMLFPKKLYPFDWKSVKFESERCLLPGFGPWSVVWQSVTRLLDWKHCYPAVISGGHSSKEWNNSLIGARFRFTNKLFFFKSTRFRHTMQPITAIDKLNCCIWPIRKKKTQSNVARGSLYVRSLLEELEMRLSLK